MAYPSCSFYPVSPFLHHALEWTEADIRKGETPLDSQTKEMMERNRHLLGAEEEEEYYDEDEGEEPERTSLQERQLEFIGRADLLYEHALEKKMDKGKPLLYYLQLECVVDIVVSALTPRAITLELKYRWGKSNFMRISLQKETGEFVYVAGGPASLHRVQLALQRLFREMLSPCLPPVPSCVFRTYPFHRMD